MCHKKRYKKSNLHWEKSSLKKHRERCQKGNVDIALAQAFFLFPKMQFWNTDRVDADEGVAACVPVPGVADNCPSSECHPGPALYWAPETTQLLQQHNLSIATIQSY